MTTEMPNNKLALVSRFQMLMTALQALPDSDSLALGGKSYAKSAVLAVLAGYVTAHQATVAEKQRWKKSVADEKAALAAARPIRALVKTYLQARLGKTSADLSAYGFEPAKTPKKTVASKSTAIAKNKATRAARHTTGSRKKLAIKGDPTTAPAAPTNAAPGGGSTTAAPSPAATTAPTAAGKSAS